MLPHIGDFPPNWWPGADRMDEAASWTYNRIGYALTDVRKDLKRWDQTGEWLED
ncbi:hypothetical protein Cali_34 [Mycobacterium phage Cali]|uniref:Uncharacterized protein n=45 Tax=Bixzunavirus TaxID=680114 RepID=Q853P3_BPMBZ|nr:gp34 [Mycobacterium phage Bxz1]YP_002224067.1 hypothetical protein SCOTTMCG_34 [Mycobacterium phage ScottMcG]YP_002224290.1 gp36 [Mycobacterium phage Spud]YP_002224511.1 gp34 [Mycobacterium phage Cali]YP_002224730.1 gp32 [Mycobacterium phage Rizal]YP_003347712.1 hypothetical protein ET08_29 [Mycobacterium phage ET08]YP_008060834.1 hypothetical protein M181_gp037 [Mycobacterium phage Gizmo]YP_008061292.1 hypothetical protein M180_gp034 [Mycobacterium phage ArcherS7]YP_008061531.1 hypothet